MKAIRLKTEYLSDPIGIDIDRPRLFWNCQGGIKQTAYQIIASNDAGVLLWDSGEVESGSMRTRWGGAPVPARTRVLWKIRLWDENGEPGQWSEAYFETGLPKGEPWRAKWISGDYTPKKRERYPVDCFRKTFSASGVKKARLYITACGLYEARLNGRRVGDFVLAPGHTDYRKRVQVQTYDVTALLREGENVLTVQLADGWYRGSCGAWGLRNQYGTQTKLLAQLEMTGGDGRVTTLRTGESWEWSNDGSIRFADNQDGEVVDARMTPGYGGRARVVRHDVIPTASNNVPVTEHEKFSPKLIKTPSGKTVLDFGQNIAGYVAFSLEARAGQRLRLRFGELLDKDGEFTQKNIQCASKRKTTPLQQVEYICRDGRNDYKTTFATTIWESWEGTQAQNGTASLDHYSKGAAVEWLFTTMCGIRVEGENRFTIAPSPGGHFTHAKADYISVYGRVESSWRRTEDGTEFSITIPANCTARVALPDGGEREQGPGTRTYRVPEV